MQEPLVEQKSMMVGEVVVLLLECSVDFFEVCEERLFCS